MQCTNPQNYYPNGVFNANVPPCGNCLACRMNDRQMWASRLVCERKSHDQAQFLTLTYRDECLPTSGKEAVITFQKFIRRYKNKTGSQPRYYACMEYGSRFGRLHWHAIFFGKSTHFERRRANGHSIVVDPTIEDTWENGSTYVKDCNYATQGLNITRYVVGYILKDAWKAPDNNTLRNKSEQALQSRRPYIGQPVMNQLLDLFTTKQGANRCAALGTVPDRIKFAKKYYRLYPRIRKEACAELGYPYLAVPWNDGTIIDIDGQKILKETPRSPKQMGAAICAQESVAKAIRQRRRLNVSTETG